MHVEQFKNTFKLRQSETVGTGHPLTQEDRERAGGICLRSAFIEAGAVSDDMVKRNHIGMLLDFGRSHRLLQGHCTPR